VSDNFMKSNPALDAAINSADNHEALREAMLSVLAAQGTVVRDRTDPHNTKVISQPTPPPAPRQEDGLTIRDDHRCERVIYPYQNARIVLTGLSEQELDEIEARVRAVFPAR
jgi:hypothetical protein